MLSKKDKVERFVLGFVIGSLSIFSYQAAIILLVLFVIGKQICNKVNPNKKMVDYFEVFILLFGGSFSFFTHLVLTVATTGG